VGRNLVGLAGWLAVTFAAAFAGSRSMPDDWYALIAKPSWTPPNAVFGPVWTGLYLAMAIAAWLVWRRAGFAGAGAALALYGLQLVLNGLWSYLFFGRHQPGWAFADIVALWCVILATTVAFARVHLGAMVLMLPYLAWVTFAAALNFAIWRMN
jgi:benzodiazapine receptor